MYKLFSKICRFLRRRMFHFLGIGIVEMGSTLSARVIRANGKIEDLGVICRKKVTDVFVNYLVDSLQNSTTSPMDVFKYHDSGIGTTPENKTDTALETPCGDARDEGTQIEGVSANIFRTVAIHTYTADKAITEHGVFSAMDAGTLMDRSVFGIITVGNQDKIEFTYELTCNSET